MLEGPRALRKEEILALGELLDSIFRSDRPGSMLEECPQLINEENLPNLRVFVEGGRIVSHVGMTRRGASLEGTRLELACIGAVATLPEYRGRGLATRLMQDAISLARADGASIMWISGGRGLYTRLGARPVGAGKRFHPASEELSRLGEAEVVELDASRIDELQELYAREPVRFIRHREDWERAFSNRFVMDGPAEFLGVGERGELSGYLIVQRPQKEGHSLLAEYAGERRSLARALGAAAGKVGAKSLGIHVPREEAELDRLLSSIGAGWEASTVSGTCVVLDFARLMEEFRGRVAERCGWGLARSLSFPERGEERVISGGDEELVFADRAEAVGFVFGGPERPEPATGLGKRLSRAFPAPAPWYGVNYV